MQIGLKLTIAELTLRHSPGGSGATGGGDDNLFQFDGENFQFDGENMMYED